ncbi:MAG: hypothetical protein HOV81_38655 [Kofleriaceae bacterium]|nr:hypothetical protein [Kofleriaceae bacterium]
MGDSWSLIKAEFRIDRPALERAAAAHGNESVDEMLEFAEQESGICFDVDSTGNVVSATIENEIDMPSEFERVCEQLAPYVRKGSFLELEIEGGHSRLEFDGEGCDWVEVEDEKPKKSWLRRLFGG